MNSALRATPCGQVVAQQTLYPLHYVAAGGIFRRAWDTVPGWFG